MDAAALPKDAAGDDANTAAILGYFETIPSKVFKEGKKPDKQVIEAMAEHLAERVDDFIGATKKYLRLAFENLCCLKFPHLFDKDAVNAMIEAHTAFQTTRSQMAVILGYFETIPSKVFKEGKNPDEQVIIAMATYLAENFDDDFIGATKKYLRLAFKDLSQEFPHHFDKDAVNAMIERHTAFLKTRSQPPKERKFVGIAFQISESALSHQFDVKYFADAIRNVFDSYYANPNEYIAPYFCFLQSSGMGKTKIMYEYKKATKKADNRHALLFLCRPMSTESPRKEEEETVFDTFLNVDGYIQKTDKGKIDLDETKTSLFAGLDKIITDKGLQGELTIMFDEVHYLLPKMEYEKNGKDGSMEALLFRLVRVWLRKKRSDLCVAAIFSGTATKIKNFHFEHDADLQQQTDSREPGDDEFFTRGTGTFPTFFMTTTIGCLRKKVGDMNSDTEYTLAIPYGRPLFTTMESRNELRPNLHSILRRMLNQNPSAWQFDNSALLSILGTRVQMGQMAFDVASNLVEKSYANLTSVGKETATVCFMPDPVCAQLAMCMMDKDWQLERLQGRDKKWWVRKTKDLFSSGMCTPEKGDFGEVMVALYFLMGADVLRKKNNSGYTKFSVSLKDLLDLLVNGREEGGNPIVDSDGEQYLNYESDGEASDREAFSGCQSETSPMEVSKHDSREPKKARTEGTVTFGAIQVCRNYNRAYGQSWKGFASQEYLKQLYESGVGFYVFQGCDDIDLVFPLKRSGTEDFFFPLVISIKSRVYFGPQAAYDACESMKVRANQSKLTCAVCLLVVFGSNVQSKDFESVKYDASLLDPLYRGENALVASVLRMPLNDCFGISEAFTELTLSCAPELSEVFASHAFIAGREESRMNCHKSFATRFLRVRRKKKKKKDVDMPLTLTDELTKQLWNIGLAERVEPMELEDSNES